MVLEGLSEFGKRLFGLISGAVRRGLSASRTLLLLQQHGMGYRREDFYRDFRRIAASLEDWSGMKYIRRDRIIPEEWYKVASHELKAPLLTKFEVIVRDKRTGEILPEPRYITIGHSTLRRRGDLEEMVKRVWKVRHREVRGESGDLEIVSMRPVEAWKSPSRLRWR